MWRRRPNTVATATACVLLCTAAWAAPAFDSVSVSVRGGLRLVGGRAATVKVSADGSCVCLVPGRPARGERKAWRPARLVHRLSQERVQELESVLADTKWLTLPKSAGPPPVDASQYEITLVRLGREHTITCNPSWPAPYVSLIGFFEGIMRQESLVYRLSWISRKESLSACEELTSEIEALSGGWGRMHPRRKLDYARFLPRFKQVLDNPYRAHPIQIRTAIKLVTYLKDRSECPHIRRLLYVLDDRVQSAAAQAVADLGDAKAIPALVETLRATHEARWSLIRFGRAAVPYIVRVIEPGAQDDNLDSVDLVRTYIEHWGELPGPLDIRVVAAARRAVAATESRTWRDYYEQFLRLAVSDPPPVGDVTCLINQQWTVVPRQPVRVVHGWYVVAGDRVVQHGAGPSPDAGEELFRIRFDVKAEAGRVMIRCGWEPVAGRREETVAERAVDLPGVSEVKRVYSCFDRRPFANEVNPVRLADSYRTLWEGHLLKNGQVVGRLIHAARVVPPDEPKASFAPPAVPAATRAKPAEPAKQIVFRGLDLTARPLKRDPALIHALELALNYHAIREAGGEPPGDVEGIDVIYRSGPREESGLIVTVFHVPAKRVFYISAHDPGARTTLMSGPFPGDPYEQLHLPRPTPKPH